MCVNEYHGHKKGCPNYGKRADCPPFVPMFDKVFDLGKPVFAVFSVYDLGAHVEKMRARHPGWTEAQLLNVLYWQGTAKKELRERIAAFNRLYREKGYYTTTSPEAMGVDVTKTLANAGVALEWPARKSVRKVAFAGVPANGDYLDILV